ncbi:phospholipase-like protein [Tanacetum coccineum]
MAGVDINTLTMEQYLAFSRENQASGLVKPEIRGNVHFKIKSQFMRELREDTFSGNKNEDAHAHIDRVLSIVGLFNISRVSIDAVMLRVFPFTLTGAAKRYLGSPPKGLSPTHDEITSRNIGSSSSIDRLAALVGCQIYEGPHLDKDCPLNEEVKQVEEVSSSSGQIKIVTVVQEASMLNNLHGVSFISETESDTLEVLQHQLPPKELNPRSFTLPCMIGKFNFYAMADLGASINVMPRSIFEHLHLTNLKKANMLCEMAYMSKMAPLGIVENIQVKIDKFLFPSDLAYMSKMAPLVTPLLKL